MTTAFSSIVGAIVTALETGPAVSSHVFRARMRAISQTWTDAIVVRLQDAQVDVAAGQGVLGIWATAVAVECYSRAGADTSADVAVDSLLDAVVTRLMSDRSLGGLVGDIGLSNINYDYGIEGETTACATLVLSIRHATAANSIHQQ